jgi:hypothetical protein
MATQVIYQSQDGVEYSYKVSAVELNGLPINSSTFQLSLGSPDAPADWDNNVDLVLDSNTQATFKILIDDTFAPGTYWVWVRVIDGPETIVRKLDYKVIIK